MPHNGLAAQVCRLQGYVTFCDNNGDPGTAACESGADAAVDRARMVEELETKFMQKGSTEARGIHWERNY
jgi:hypothetical protein